MNAKIPWHTIDKWISSSRANCMCLLSLFNMENDSEDVIVLIRKPNTTSIAWNYFGLEANERGMLKQDKDQAPVC